MPYLLPSEIMALPADQRRVALARNRILDTRNMIRTWIACIKHEQAMLRIHFRHLRTWENPMAKQIPSTILRDPTRDLLTHDFSDEHIQDQINRYTSEIRQTESRLVNCWRELRSDLAKKSQLIRELRTLTQG